GIEPARAFRAEARYLRLGEGDAPERRAHHRAHLIAVFPRRVERRVGEREPRARHGQLGEPVEPLGSLGVQMVLRAKVGDFSGDPTAKRGRVEARDLANGGYASREPSPQPLDGGADRRHCADARDHDAPQSILHTRTPPSRSMTPLIPANVRFAIPWTNTGPITRR